MIVIYWDGKKPVKIEIEKNDWKNLPHSILKVYDGIVEKSGWQGYALHDNEVIGINTTKTNGKTNPLEDVICPTDNIKFGVTIPDDEWRKVTSTRWLD